MSQTAGRLRHCKAFRPAAVGLVVVVAVILGALGYHSPSLAPSFGETVRGAATPTRAGVTEADGVLPSGVTAYDNQYPGVAHLDPDLLRALHQATTDRASAQPSALGVSINSGWRSARYQTRLLDEAVVEYGSKEEAARWVATPETSPHVSGDAVDVGPDEAAAWLAEHGARYGLCQIYRNEPWHFELRPEAVDHGCPFRYDDPTHDPRMNP